VSDEFSDFFYVHIVVGYFSMVFSISPLAHHVAVLASFASLCPRYDIDDNFLKCTHGILMKLDNIVIRYLRIKRRNQTFCVLCQETDTIGHVKEKLIEVMQQHDIRLGGAACTAAEMRLLKASNGEPIHDSNSDGENTIQAAQLKDDQVLHLVFRMTDDEYEPVEIISTDLQDAS
jgi:ferredoxin